MARPAGYRTGAHGGGNFTRGANRKGNRNGRKPLHPRGTPLARVSVVIPLELHSVLRVIGAGNVSEGARVSIDWATKLMPVWAQNLDKVKELLGQRVYGKAQAKSVTHKAYERFERALRSYWDDVDFTAALPPSFKSPSGVIDDEPDAPLPEPTVYPEDEGE